MSSALSARLVQGWGSFTIPCTHQGQTLLHFPSTNSAAHKPAQKDVARLSSLLNDDVWAFTNCRVEAPGRAVAEIDWFFYNTVTGVLMVSEWKRFPQAVALAADTGQPWLLGNGTGVPNPIEQVSGQLDVVRAVIRRSVLKPHFSGFNEPELRLAQCVYCPQIDSATVMERFRFGKVYGTLADLASVVQTLTSPSPLLLHDDGGRLPLARTLCALFRCSISSEVEAKLHTAQAETPPSRASVVKRISEIHREIAKLHRELSHLTLLAEQSVEPELGNARQVSAKSVVATPAAVKSAAHVPAPPAHAAPAPAPAPAPVSSAAVLTPAAAPVRSSDRSTDLERMKAHLSREFTNVNGSADAAKAALGKAWVAVLRDPSLQGKNGTSLAVFGSAATPLVKAKHESVRKLVGMQLAKWCLLHANQSGLKAVAVPGNPSNIRLR